MLIMTVINLDDYFYDFATYFAWTWIALCCHSTLRTPRSSSTSVYHFCFVPTQLRDFHPIDFGWFSIILSSLSTLSLTIFASSGGRVMYWSIRFKSLRKFVVDV